MASRLHQEAIDRIEDLSLDRMSVEEFEDWSSIYSWNIHKSNDREAQRIAYEIRGILNDYPEEAESQMRLELKKLIRPFVSKRPVASVSEYSPREEYRARAKGKMLAAVAVISVVALGEPISGYVSLDAATT